MTYIFDLDGTLIDSNGLWEQVDREFLGRRGLAPTREYLETVGRSIFPVAAQYTRTAFSLPDSPEDIMAEWTDLARDWYARRVELKRGARALLERLRAAGEPMAVFTASRRELCLLALERHGLTPFFGSIVFAEDIGLEKHDPRCFLRLSQLLDTPPEQCVLLDDSPYNCATARAVGMSTVGVYDDFYAPLQDELRAVCSRYVTSLEELLGPDETVSYPQPETGR